MILSKKAISWALTAIFVQIALAIAIPAHCEVRIGVGDLGPISPEAVYQVQQLVDAIPGVKAVPIVPPGGVDACVKRFVAGEPDDKLDGVMVISLPQDSFKLDQSDKEATFSGTYEIWLLNLSTLAEDRHTFNFEEREDVVGGVGAILAIPAQLVSERAGQGRIISGSANQAYQTVQARIGNKLVAATKLYLATSPIKSIGPLNPLETAEHLVDRGDAETAMAVFKSAGVNDPRVQSMIASANERLKRADASKALGRTLGALAADDPDRARSLFVSYEQQTSADRSRIPAIQSAIASESQRAASGSTQSVLRSDVPGLDLAAFVAMLNEVFVSQTGNAPDEISVAGGSVKILDRKAAQGIKARLDGYARAMGETARLASVKCGCASEAMLTGDVAGPAILRAKFDPSSQRPQVGIP